MWLLKLAILLWFRRTTLLYSFASLSDTWYLDIALNGLFCGDEMSRFWSMHDGNPEEVEVSSHQSIDLHTIEAYTITSNTCSRFSSYATIDRQK